MNIEKFKEIFIERKNYIINSLKNTNNEIDVDGDEVDEASAGILSSLSVSISKRQLKQLRDIDRALNKIEDGTFGECEECGADIGERRLLAKPDAITCINCAESLEANARQYAD